MKSIPLCIYPLSEEWDEGVGKEIDIPKTTDGCSWLYRKNRDGASEVEWTTLAELILWR